MCDGVVRLITLLAEEIVGPDIDENTKDFALRILASRLYPSTSIQPMHVRHLVHKHLTRINTPKLSQKLSEFDDIISQLTSSTKLQHKGAILYTLYAIAAENNYDDFVDICKPLPIVSSVQSKQVLTPAKTHTKIEATVSPSKEKKTRIVEPMCIKESELLRCILFAMQGIESATIQWDPKAESFSVSPKIHIPLSCRNMIAQICEIGRLFRRVQCFIERPQYGLIHQAFVASLGNHIAQYYRLIAVLETQLQDTLLSLNGKLELTIRQLFVWVILPMQNMKNLAILSDSAQGRKGGALLSALHCCHHHGNPDVKNLISGLLNDSCRPLFSYLQCWISNGEIHDPFQEFFINVNNDTVEDRFWQEKYTLRQCMIPSFLGIELSTKIMVIGKSINFIRRCDGELGLELSIQKTFSRLGYADLRAMRNAVELASSITNTRLNDIVLHQHCFQLHCLAIKRYLLLGQGDFIQHLMDLLCQDLDKPAAKIFHHQLAAILETAIRSSNAQYENTDVLNRLTIRLLEPSPGDIGWDIFSLDYRIGAPLNVVFTQESMQRYLRLFNFLWRLKRLEHVLASTWKRHNTHAVRLESLDAIQNLLFKGHILRNEMVHLVANLHNYFKFEVLECSWTEFSETCEKAEDLEHLVKAHASYIEQLLDKAFMGQFTAKSPLQTHLTALCECILRFGYLQDRLYDTALQELERRRQRSIEAERLAAEGQWEYPPGIEGVEGDPAKAAQIATRFSSQFDDVAKTYRDELAIFLDHLGQQRYPNDLRFLSFRLDFNQYYEPIVASKQAIMKHQKNLNESRCSSNDGVIRSLDDALGDDGRSSRFDENEHELENDEFRLDLDY